MAIKTFINGQENGVITFKDDTEPCAVYVNGERQDNISYIPTLAEGADSVSYKSEYKNNLRTLQIEGNTEQGDGYQAVEYIESTGTQYIDTGILGKSSLRIVVKTNYAEGALLGTQSNTNTDKSIAIVGASAEYVRFMTSGGTRVSANYTSKPPYEIDLSIANFKVTSNDGQSYTQSLNGTSTTIDYPIYVFARNIDGQASGFSKRKVYSLKIYDNGTLVRDYIPCYRKSDNVIGLYDLVNGVFYTNQGTGTFLKGADVLTQIGGTTKPTIANPAPITNCGNGQIEIVAKGVNEFDISKIKLRAIWSGIGITSVGKNSITITSTEDVPDDNNGYCGSGVKLKEACPNIKVGKPYRLTLNNSGKANKMIFLNNGTSWYSGNVITITEKMLNATIVFYGFNRESNLTAELPVSVEIFDIMITEVDNTTDYEPYFEPVTVSIPANTVLDNDDNTLLELAGLGEYKDTISIDRVSNKVKYIQRICRVRPFVNIGGTLEYGGSSGGNPDEWFFPLNKNAQVGIGKCEFSPIINDVSGENEFGVSIYDTLIYISTPKSLGLNSLEALANYVSQNNADGLSIFYALETPIEWTVDSISDTELKAQFEDLSNRLLEWAKNTKNQTNIVEITSTPSVSKTSVNYAKWGGVPNENNT